MPRPTNASKEKKFLKALAVGNSIGDAALLANYNLNYAYRKLREDPAFAEKAQKARAGLHDEIVSNITHAAKEDPKLGLQVMSKLDKAHWADHKVVEHNTKITFDKMVEVIDARAQTLLGDVEEIENKAENKADTKVGTHD